MARALSLLRVVGVPGLLLACTAPLVSRVRAVQVEGCMVGYVMDTFCINRGTLLDNPSLTTLDHPQDHTVHCLVDVDSCWRSGFELLRDPAGSYEASGIHCRAFQLDKNGNELALSFARATGKKGGCTTCTGGADGLVKGMRATMLGTYDNTEPLTSGPRTLKVSRVLPASVGCNASNEIVVTDADCFSEAGGEQGFVLAHGSLMLISWGVFLPSGVILAHFLRYLDPLWFKLHRAIQSFGLLLALVGFIIAVSQFAVFKPGYYLPAQIHGSLGVIVMTIGLLQPVNAYFRPHKHKGEKVSSQRRCWELYHKGSGYLAVLLALVTIGIGTTLVGGNNTLIFQIVYGVVGAGLVILAIVLYLAQRKHNSSAPATAAEDARGVEATAVALPSK